MDEYILLLTWIDSSTKKVITTSKISFNKEVDANRAADSLSRQSTRLPYEIIGTKLY